MASQSMGARNMSPEAKINKSRESFSSAASGKDFFFTDSGLSWGPPVFADGFAAMLIGESFMATLL
jgi:hypothetical protein